MTDWLAERSIPKDPYRGDISPAFHLRFQAPSSHRQLDALSRHYYDRIIPESESLVHMADWGLYEQSDMIAITGIRSSRSEDGLLIDAPGHVLTIGQSDIGIALFGLSASFAWTSYVYSAHNHSTLLNWEGDIFDFWSDSEEALSEMRVILEQFDLSETIQGEQDTAGQSATVE